MEVAEWEGGKSESQKERVRDRSSEWGSQPSSFSS